MPNGVLQIEIDTDVGERLIAESEATGEPVSKLASGLLRDVLEQRGDYDAWFRRQVEEALRQADDPSVERIPHEVIKEEWWVERAELLARAEAHGL